MIAETTMALKEMALSLWKGVLTVVPGLVAGLIVLIVGYLIGAFLGYIVRTGLHKTKIFDKLLKANFHKIAGKFDFPAFFGTLVKWYVIILFLNPVATIINLSGLSWFFASLSVWIPRVIIAIVIGLLGLIAAEYVDQKIKETKAKGSIFLGPIAKIVILVFTAIIALQQIGLNISIVENTFLIVLAGIMLTLAIGFGLALKDEAHDIIKRLKKEL